MRSRNTTETVVDVAMPKLSDSMEEATVLAWLKRPGDVVERGEPLVEVETDKATVVYEAELNGVLDEILVDDGQTAALGAPIARLRTGDAPAAVPKPAPAAKPGRPRATPVARELANERGVSLDGIDGSGPGGRIVAADVPAGSTDAAPASGRGTATPVSPTPTQRTIAQRMAASRASIPEFTVEAEIDMDAAARLREELRSAGAEPVPSFNDLLIRAVALALRAFPALNATYEDDRPVRHSRVNVGFAVDAGDALIVPTVYDADTKPVPELAGETRALAEGARNRTLSPEGVAGGTFTVSNLGMLGVRRFNAVINPPQAAILAVGEVAERAVVRDGQVVPRPVIDASLSCDHRVVYGAEAARFLGEVRRLLEHPSLLLIGSQ
jgi:pyruvate dehydrogenase E2 component (dihydrolipoyllysine-residue acetyltransferase)